MSPAPPPARGRFTPAATVTVLLLSVALSACGAANPGDSGSSSSTATSGPWVYTDDTGHRIELSSPPDRVAAFADQALVLLSYGVEPVAIFGRVDVESDPRFEGYDLSDVRIVGNTYGEIDLEALAATSPDLVVTGIYPTDRKGTLDLDGPLYGLADTEQQQQIEKLAPIAAIEIGREGKEVIDSSTDLAQALGADEDRVAVAKDKFEEASSALREAAEQNPRIEVTQMYADADGIYVVKVRDEPETQLYRQMGVTFTDLNPGGEYYWDQYSWENARQMMTGDLLLTNVEGYQADELTDQPTFAGHPALKADQVHTWNGAAMDYASQAEQMRTLADLIDDAQDVN